MRSWALFILVAGFLALLPTPTPAQHCQQLGCATECWQVGPGHRRCRRHCTRRCWHQPPRYEPRYEPRHGAPEPRYVAPQRSYAPDSGQPLPLEVVAIIGLVLILGILALAGASQPSIERDIESIEKSALSARAQARSDERQTAEIDGFIAQAQDDAFEQGRADADKEWDKQLKKGWTDE